MLKTVQKTLLRAFDILRIYGLPVLAALGIFSAIKVVSAGSQPRPYGTPLASPPSAPFLNTISGAGIIEALGDNIAVAPQVSGVVSQVFVKVGDVVEKDAPLFSLDDSMQRATLEQKQGALLVAKAKFEDARSQLNYVEKLSDKGAVSNDELSRKRSQVAIMEAQVKEAEGALQVASADLARQTIKAPQRGTILRSEARPGEFMQSALTTSTPPVVLGDISKFQIRVDIDENDAWRASGKGKARASLRGNSAIGFDVQFVRFEPLIIPKKSLTGDSQERVDTRVLQAIFSFEKKELPVYVGQLVDVFIEAEG